MQRDGIRNLDGRLNLSRASSALESLQGSIHGPERIMKDEHESQIPHGQQSTPLASLATSALLYASIEEMAILQE